MKKINKREAQRGVALLTVMLFLLLLSGLAVGMMYMSSTETQINANFRNEQVAYFAARAGLEELRDRMRPGLSTGVTLPTTAPTSGATTGVTYLINQGTDPNTVKPWSFASDSKYPDTELCHDGYTAAPLGGLVNDEPCTSTAGGTYYTTATSNLTFSGSAGAIPYKWARVTLKQNNSVPGHMVNSALTATNFVCWNGSYEQVLTAATCSAQWESSTPVYLITALAVTNNGSGFGARKMVQAEVAQTPSGAFAYGMFATGSGCGAISLGGGASTDAYNSSVGAYGGTNVSETQGGIGSNGNITTNGSGVSIGGNVGSPLTPAVIGSCPDPLTVNGNGGFYPGVGNQINTIPIENIPAPSTGTDASATTIDDKYFKSCKCSNTLSPGTYNSLSVNNTVVTLNPGTYYFNNVSIGANAEITMTGAVTMNIVATGQTGTVVDIEGQGFVNTTQKAANFEINYAGSGTIKMDGGAGAYAVVDAPNANIQLGGNGSCSGTSCGFYGAILGNTISLGGGMQFHYDEATSLPIPTATYFTLLSFRELYY